MTAQQEPQIYDGPERRADPHITLKTTIKEAFKEALTEVAKDRDIVQGFWKQGYQELSGHAGNGARQWIGGRIMTLIAVAALSLAINYLAKTGAIK